MDGAIAMFNLLACLVLAVVAGWIVLAPQVREGFVTKVGLVGVSLGFLLTAWGLSAERVDLINRALLLLHGGGTIVALGYVLRMRRGARKRRRASDWADTERAPGSP